MPYRRREIWLLLVLVGSLGVGLAMREFRSGFPALAERLENLDAEVSPNRVTSTATPAFHTRPPKISEWQAQRDGRLDLNRATAGDLQRLPGVGPALAGQILRARERQGRFAAAEDVLRVPGLGRKKFERIRDLVTARGPEP